VYQKVPLIRLYLKINASSLLFTRRLSLFSYTVPLLFPLRTVAHNSSVSLCSAPLLHDSYVSSCSAPSAKIAPVTFEQTRERAGWALCERRIECRECGKLRVSAAAERNNPTANEPSAQTRHRTTLQTVRSKTKSGTRGAKSSYKKSRTHLPGS